MKKKYIAIIVSVIIIIIGGICIYSYASIRNNSKNNIGTSSSIIKSTVNEKSHSNFNLYKNIVGNKAGVINNKEAIVQKPNTISNTIQILDEQDTDNATWWGASKAQLIDKLTSEANKYHDKDIQSIVYNQNKIPVYLIQLAVMHPESIPYVAGYPNRKLNQPINIEYYYTKGQIPLFQQFDKQWAYDKYGNGPIGMDGCGPTAVAMVVVGLTGNLNVNPRLIAQYGETHGGYTCNLGSNATLMTTVAEHFGVKEKEIASSQVIESLKNGHPVIVSLGPGEFTMTGHLMVLTGVTPDGKIKINDPDSIKFSKETWDFKTINSSAREYYSYTKA